VNSKRKEKKKQKKKRKVVVIVVLYTLENAITCPTIGVHHTAQRNFNVSLS
jgi:hypothetical protein